MYDNQLQHIITGDELSYMILYYMTKVLLLLFIFLDQVHTRTLYVIKAGSYLRHMKIYHLLKIRQFFSPTVHGSCFWCILITVKFSACVFWIQLFQLQISSLVSDGSIGSPLREEQTRSQSAFFLFPPVPPQCLACSQACL